MNWSEEQLESHIRAAKKLDVVMEQTFLFIKGKRDNIDEFSVQEFIKERFVENNLISDSEPPIVAFGVNTQNVHYFPSRYQSSVLEENELIMIDIWARENVEEMPFADITAMGYSGNVHSSEELKIFNIVIKARDAAITFIQDFMVDGEMPEVGQIDSVVRNIFNKHGLLDNFLHTTGHLLGFDEAHGDKQGIIYYDNQNELLENIGFTIEPGLYLEGKFGVRSEIDCYISSEGKLVITTNVQREIVRV